MRTLLIAITITFASASHAGDVALPFVWSDQNGTREMPWMGRGGRAHWFVIDKTKPWDFMNPRGPTRETHWGSGGGSGESPWETAERAMDFLGAVGFLKPWPVYPGDSSQKDAVALPFRITIISIKPTVAILRFDLAAAIEDPIPFSAGAYPPSQSEIYPDQSLGWARTPNKIMFGTHLVDRGTLLWFCPDEKIAPSPLNLSTGHVEIVLREFRLAVDRKDGELEVTWKRR